MILRAQVVLPISRPLIRDGAVTVVGRRIRSVEPWSRLTAAQRRSALDLGPMLLLPGLINAHCHLDYTHMAGQLPPPRQFTDWLKLITATKSSWNLKDYEESWQAGAQMLVQSGTTTVGDIEAVPQLLPGMWQTTPLRVFSFLEMIGLTARRPAGTVLQEVLDKTPSLRHSRCRPGLSPHATYTATADLMRLSARTGRRRHFLLATHLAESALEFEMFTRARGEMYEWLKRSGRDMADCGRGSPVQHLDRCGLLGPNLLAAHVNYLARGDAQLLAARKVNVVHCPRSRFYFRHAPFPIWRLARAGVNLCLGTDSLASVIKTRRQTVELSLFDEMRTLAEQEPELPARTIVRMVTINGARALAQTGKLGELSAGAKADLIALPMAAEQGDHYAQVVRHSGPVSASMIDGAWVIPPKEATSNP